MQEIRGKSEGINLNLCEEIRGNLNEKSEEFIESHGNNLRIVQ